MSNQFQMLMILSVGFLVQVDLLINNNMILINRIYIKRLKMLTQKYLLLMIQSKRLIIIQKLQKLKTKIPNTTDLAITTEYDTKNTEIENYQC